MGIIITMITILHADDNSEDMHARERLAVSSLRKFSGLSAQQCHNATAMAAGYSEETGCLNLTVNPEGSLHSDCQPHK